MERLRENISPALILSVVAVFIALGGGAYAALGVNSVGTKQLKKNAVTAKKIKKDAVVAAKIKAGSIGDSKIAGSGITGAKIDEATLGQVPSAAKAATADSATTAASATSATKADSATQLDGLQRVGLKRASSSASNPSFSAAQGAATKVPMLNAGSISIYGKCFTVGSTLYANSYIESSANGAIFDSQYDQAFGGPSFLDVGTPEDERELFFVSAGPDSYGYYANPEPTYALTAAGDSYRFNTNAYVKQGTLPGGNGPYGPGNVCLFVGSGGLN